MTRTEMIREIANQANCSKRLVRKKLFQLSARFKKDRYKRLRFNQAFLDKNTEWLDRQELHDKWKNGLIDSQTFWRMPNTFEVAFFPSGCVVLFTVEAIDTDGYRHTDTCGARLYNF